jgi:hypothetical protein
MTEAARAPRSDWMALAGGIVALACLGAGLLFKQSLAAFMVIQLVPSLIAVAGATMGWRTESRPLIVTGLLCMAMSWFPLAFFVLECSTGNCL